MAKVKLTGVPVEEQTSSEVPAEAGAELIQQDLNLSEETIAEVEEALAHQDEYALPKLKQKDVVTTPGHTTRAFRQ